MISAGTLDLLDSAELAAVLAHERAHLRERHDLVLLPFIALLHGVPLVAGRPQGRTGRRAAGRDARRRLARRHRPARELATALLRVGAAGGGLAPSGALAAARPALADGEVAARVTRLLRPAPGPARAGRWPWSAVRRPPLARGAGRRPGHAVLARARSGGAPR